MGRRLHAPAGKFRPAQVAAGDHAHHAARREHRRHLRKEVQALTCRLPFFAAFIGTLLGLIAGYRGGWIDSLIMRISELFLSFPPLLLSLVAVTFLGPGLVNALIALIISWWPWYARLIRVEASIVKSKPYVEISAAMGVPDRIIIFRHILRNVTTPLIVQIAADLGTVILAAGSLAFIGLGAQPPSADWGLMVAQGRNLIFDQWWISTFSGLAIFLAVLSFNIIGDALRDHFDPRITRQ